jgi:DNA-binding NarL/FixJ family response regulator
MTDTCAETPTITIAILSSQCLVWLGLQTIIESSMTVPMVVHPYPGRRADLLRAEGRPDVFILDLETERDALGTIEQIRESAPASKIVLLCGLEENDHAREAFAAGVDGVILKMQPPAVVLAVLKALYAPVKPTAQMGRDGAGGHNAPFTNKPPAWPEALTEREREIIRLVGQGLSNKDIADNLSISDSTVRYHMTSIFDKVGVPNRQQLLLHTQSFCSTAI